MRPFGRRLLRKVSMEPPLTVLDAQRAFVRHQTEQVEALRYDFRLLRLMRVDGCLVFLGVKHRIDLRLVLALSSDHGLSGVL